MALPVAMLIAAATKIAQDERAQRAAKSLWDKGMDAWGKRKSGQPDVVGADSSGWQAGGDRQARFAHGQTGDLIRFTYTDEHGLICQRTVGNWRSEGGQLTGYCLNRKQEESFAVGQIGEWEEFPVGAGA